MEDSKIIALLTNRSEEGLSELSQKYGAIFKRVAFNIVGNHEDAEECVNDALLVVWNTVPPQTPDPLVTYVCRIVRNLALKKIRANTTKKRNGQYDVVFEEIEDCIASSASVEDEMDSAETIRKLNLFLETLDQEGRTLFVRRYWYSDSIEDLAVCFRTNTHTVSVRLSRIRKKLEIFLKKEGISV